METNGNSRKLFGLCVIVTVCILVSFFSAPAMALDRDAAYYEKLLPLHQAKISPQPGDWLAEHQESGQTFADYAASNPARPAQGQVIYLALLGDFDKTQREIIEICAQFMEVYFGMRVKFTSPILLSEIPSEARRVHPQTGDRQILSTYVLDKILRPRLPKDAFCLMAFTTSDLWPGQGWNFVFGQASPQDRVAVWSVYRNGDPRHGRDAFQLCLIRTLKTGTHEIGHMYGMDHCVFYECNMNGSNHRLESDKRPLWLCPVCLRKLIWATGMDPVLRYERLERACRELGLTHEADFYQRSLLR